MRKLSNIEFAQWLMARAAARDGYIMCSVGQDPEKLSDWYFYGQYTGKQLEKALHWKKHAAHVFDCQGLADAYVTEFADAGKVNVKARNNYADWCTVKGKGTIPDKRKLPGAAVYIHNGSYISHIGYLAEPLDADKPAGDWWVIEARGVMYGVVRTKLSARPWNRWGLMTRYFDYGAADSQSDAPRSLAYGDSGEAVKQLQASLIALGYSCGVCGADGEYGSATRAAVRAYQSAHGIDVDGVAGAAVLSAIDADLPDDGEVSEGAVEDAVAAESADADSAVSPYEVTGGSVYLWDGHPAHGGEKSIVVHRGDKLAPLDAGVYVPVAVCGTVKWINRKYVKGGVTQWPTK